MCVIIIDFYEIYNERPMSLAPTAQMWSSYKQHSTVHALKSSLKDLRAWHLQHKYWICLTRSFFPSSVRHEEAVCLISILYKELWIVEQFTTRQSDIYLLIDVLQFRKDMFCAQIKLPPFTRGKTV